MLGSSRVAAQLVAPQEELSSVSKQPLMFAYVCYLFIRIQYVVLTL
jgi:hypothetical protein